MADILLRIRCRASLMVVIKRASNPELFSHLYFEKTFVGLFDNSKIRSVVPDFVCDISLHDGIKMMVEWFELEANQVDPEKDVMEDRLVELYAGWKNQMQEFSVGP